MKIALEIKSLISLADEMQQCLNERKFEHYAQQQYILASKIKNIFNAATEQDLLSVAEELIEIQNNLSSMQENAKLIHDELKGQALTLQRTKKGINAYK